MPENLFLNPNELRKKGKIKFGAIQLNRYKKSVKAELKNYTPEQLVGIYRDMAFIRAFENALYDIKELGNYKGIPCHCHSPFHLSMGQEAAAVGQAFLLDKNDFIFGSHRSHGEILAKGFSAIRKCSDKELQAIMHLPSSQKTLQAVRNYKGFNGMPVKTQAELFFVYGVLAEILALDTGFSRGLCGSMHVFFTPFGIYPNNAVVGGSASLALGAALYKKVNKQKGVVIANVGDGAIGCGPVWETMSFATMDQFKELWEEGYNGGLPLMFNIFDNQYAMNAQTVGETMGYDVLARVGAGVTPNNMFVERVDGFNPLAVVDAYRRKLPLMRNGDGACMLDVLTYRFTGHNSNDISTYRSKKEVDAWKKVDPLITYPQSLIKVGVVEETTITGIDSAIENMLYNIFLLAVDKNVSPRMDINDLEGLMYSNGEKVAFKPYSGGLVPKQDIYRVQEIAKKSPIKDGENQAINFADGVFSAVIDKFYQDDTFICYGEECRDWGGKDGIYRGLQQLPYHKVFNTCISESAIAGSAVGYALCGGRVLAELMFIDFLGRAGDEVFNQLPKWQAMTAGTLKMPLVLKVKVGAKYGAQHSQDWSAFLMHVPGLKVVYPATPYDAKGLMATALKGTDPVIFLESQRLSDIEEVFNPVPQEEYFIPLGEPCKRTDGKDVTILTVGATLYRCYDAVKKLKEEHNITAELFDARSIVPFNYQPIIESVKKTGKIVIVSDECERCSVISEMASKITSYAFDYLKLPPKTMGAKNWITPAFEYEKDFFPQTEGLVACVVDMLK